MPDVRAPPRPPARAGDVDPRQTSLDPYSLTLAGGAATAVLALVSSAIAWLRARSAATARGGDRGTAFAARTGVAGALTSLALVAFSAGYHLLTGHRPGTGSALTVPGFVAEHQAFVVVPLLSALALVIGALVLRRRPGGAP